MDAAQTRVLDLPPHEVTRILREQYGLAVLDVTAFPSELSTVCRASVGAKRVVFKASHYSPAGHALAQWRVDAMTRLSRAGVPVGETLTDLEGNAVAAAPSLEGPVTVQVGEWLEGVPLEAAPPTDRTLLDVGVIAARVCSTLAAHPEPPLPVAHPWELVHSLDVVDETLPLVDDRQMSMLIRESADRFGARAAGILELLPRQVVHHDLHDSNLLVDPRTGRVNGVLDVGDMVVGPRIAELAVAAGYACRGADDPFAAFLRVAQGWGRLHPLSDAEVSVLLECAVVRLAVNAAVWSARSNSSRGGYARGRSAKSGRALRQLLAVDPRAARAELRSRLADTPRT